MICFMAAGQRKARPRQSQAHLAEAVGSRGDPPLEQMGFELPVPSATESHFFRGEEAARPCCWVPGGPALCASCQSLWHVLEERPFSKRDHEFESAFLCSESGANSSQSKLGPLHGESVAIARLGRPKKERRAGGRTATVGRFLHKLKWRWLAACSRHRLGKVLRET
jgi:hypothetical protein